MNPRKPAWIVIGAALFWGIVCNGASAADLAWQYKVPSGLVDCSPGVGDLNGDGMQELVVATTRGDVIALDRSGKEIWMRPTLPGRLSSAPMLADIQGDTGLEIVVCSLEGQLYCLAGATGNLLWQLPLPDAIEWGATGPAAADLDGDGRIEIIACDNAGNVSCVAGDGRMTWTRATEIGHSRWPALADLNGDGKKEILAAGDQVPLLCLSFTGEELWRISDPKPGASPIVGDFNKDGKPEVITGLGASLAMINSAGGIVWTIPMQGEIDSALTAADINNDGAMEIIAVDLKGGLICVSPEGKTAWLGNVEQRARRSPAVADVDGDGVMEILVAGYSGAIHVFKSDGQLMERIPLPGGSANCTATVLQGTRDEAPLVVCPTSGGVIPAFQWAGSGSILYGEYRGNSARTGSSLDKPNEEIVRVDRLDFGKGYVGINEFKAAFLNPSKRSLSISLEVRPGSRDPWKNEVVSSEERIANALTYILDGAQVENLTFTCMVREGDKPVFRRVVQRYVHPFQKELADLALWLMAARNDLQKAADSRGAVERIAYLQNQLPDLEHRAAVAGVAEEKERYALRDELRVLLDEAEQWTCTARYAAEHAGAPLWVCAANPWAPFGGMTELKESRTGEPGAQVQAFHGESECAAFNVFNFSGNPLYLRVEPVAEKALPEKARLADCISLREVLSVPTQMPESSADALPELNQGSVLIVPAWDARQVWVDIRTADLPPGAYALGVRWRSLQSTPLDITSPVAVTVWEPRLPEKQPLRLCHWGYVHSSFIKDYPEEALADQVALGTNVFVGVHYPKATFDAQGALVGEIDFTEHDAYVRRHAPHGIILFCGYQSALQGPAKQGEEAYRRAHIAWLRAWVAHLAEMGVGYDGFALYPVDEPGLSPGLVEQYLLCAGLAREADPRIQMYTDPVMRITMDELKRMAPFVDIWCPNRDGFLADVNADKLAFIQQLGKTVWTYECEDNAKHQSPLAYYRGQAWLVWYHGLTGIGFWTYCTSPDDPWFAPASNKEYMLIYQGQGIVRSKRWYAIRDGIEDYSMLSELRRLLAEASKKSSANETTKRAESLLDADASEIAAYCSGNLTTIPGREGLPGMRVLADKQWYRIQETRAAINETLQRLRAGK